MFKRFAVLAVIGIMALSASAHAFGKNKFEEEAEKEQGELKVDQAERPPEAGDKPQAEKKLSPLKALNEKLERAVQEERYEDAARLRDEIKRLKQTHTEN